MKIYVLCKVQNYSVDLKSCLYFFVFNITKMTMFNVYFRFRPGKILFYVTDGNIMYLTDASRFLISCVIQHYAPVVGWGVVEEQMHNVDYAPGP